MKKVRMPKEQFIEEMTLEDAAETERPAMDLKLGDLVIEK